MKSSETTPDKSGRPRIAPKLAMLAFSIASIVGAVSTACQPIVVAHGKNTTVEEYNRASRACEPIKDENEHRRCMGDEINKR